MRRICRRAGRAVLTGLLPADLWMMLPLAGVASPAAAGTPPPVPAWVQTGAASYTPVVGRPQLCGSQGIAWDGRSLWFSWNFGLTRTNLQMDRILNIDCHNAIPPSLSASRHNHIGDIDVHDGILYAPMEDGPAGFLEPVITLFRAKDLSFTGRIFPLEREYMTGGVPWVAIDAPRRVAYTAEWDPTTVLNVHRLSDLKVIRTVEPDWNVPRIQGAKVFRGQLHLSRDNGAEKSVEAIDPETGHATHLFDRGLGTNGETEGIAFIRRPTGTEMALLELYEGTPGDPSDHYTAWVKRYRIGGDTTRPALKDLQLRPRRVRVASRPQALKVRVRASEPVTVTGRWRLRLVPTDQADIRGKAATTGLTVLPRRPH